MSSIIRLDILTLPLANEYVEFQNAITPNMRETFVGLRTQFGQSTIGSNGTAEDKLNFTLGALTGALVADYNAASSFTILLNTNVPAGDLPFITIESNIYNYFTQAKWVLSDLITLINWSLSFKLKSCLPFFWAVTILFKSDVKPLPFKDAKIHQVTSSCFQCKKGIKNLKIIS